MRLIPNSCARYVAHRRKLADDYRVLKYELAREFQGNECPWTRLMAYLVKQYNRTDMQIAHFRYWTV